MPQTVNGMIKLLRSKGIIGLNDIKEAEAILTYMEKGKTEAEKISKQTIDKLQEGGFIKDGILLPPQKGKSKLDWFRCQVSGAHGYITLEMIE